MSKPRDPLPLLKFSEIENAEKVRDVLLKSCIHADQTYFVGNSVVSGGQLAEHVAHRILVELRK